MAIEYKLKFTGQEIDEKLIKVENKQDKLAFDVEPTEGSENPVTSGGIYAAIQNQINLIPTKVSQLENDRGFLVSKDIEKIDYESLENKPFYSEIVTEINRDIIPLQRIELTSGDGAPEGCVMSAVELTALSPIVSNASYNFTFDGEITQTTGIYIDGAFILGNPSLMGMGEDTGEPYIIGFSYDDGEWDSPICMVVYKATEGEHTIGLSYIGDIIPLIPEGTYNFESEIDEKDGYVFPPTYYSDEFFGLHPQDGDKYKLTIDNTVYEITTIYDDNYEAYIAGNLYLDSEDNKNTGENYFIIMRDNEIGIVMSSEGDYTVSLEKVLQSVTTEIVHKIDSKYLDIDIDMDVDVPYTEDDEGNVVFEGDIFVDGSTSIRDINENVSTMQKDINAINDNLANSSVDSQLVEGIIFDVDDEDNIDLSTRGLSANRDTVPTGKGAWIEGDGASLYELMSYAKKYSEWYGEELLNFKPYLSITHTTVGNMIATTVTIVVNFDTDEDEDKFMADLEKVSHFGVVFEDTPDTTYYLRKISVDTTSVNGLNNTAITVSFVDNYDQFPTIDETRYIQSLTLYPAIGNYSHSEGSGLASGDYSHAEGTGTIASGKYSHAQGKYNIEDTENKYAHIVGNGESDNTRSNAHTLDWDGNAWYAGTVEATGIILPSTTEGSTKRFLVTVDDTGTLSATEITE